MRRELRCLLAETLRQAATLLGLLAAMLLFFAIVMGMPGPDDIFGPDVVLYFATYMFAAVFALAHPQEVAGIHFQCALQMGATRRGWFLAMLPAQMLFSFVAAAGSVLLVQPLARWLWTGHPGVQPGGLLPLFCATLVMTGVGYLVGYTLPRLGRKALVLSIGVSLAFSALIVVMMFRAKSGWSFLRFVQGAHPLPSALVLLGCWGLTLLGSWGLVHSMPVRE